MRAYSAIAKFADVAVIAKHLIAEREVMTFEPMIKNLIFEFLAMLLTIVLDVVNRQKHDVGFFAASADDTSVSLKDFGFQAAIVFFALDFSLLRDSLLRAYIAQAPTRTRRAKSARAQPRQLQASPPPSSVYDASFGVATVVIASAGAGANLAPISAPVSIILVAMKIIKTQMSLALRTLFQLWRLIEESRIWSGHFQPLAQVEFV